jgi:hypothetical protein
MGGLVKLHPVVEVRDVRALLGNLQSLNRHGSGNSHGVFMPEESSIA